MKKVYLKPELEIVEVNFEGSLLAASNPSISIPEGGENPNPPGESKEHNSSNNSIWD